MTIACPMPSVCRSAAGGAWCLFARCVVPRALVVALLWGMTWVVAWAPASAAAEPDPAIEQGRRAMQRLGDAPWYNKPQDKPQKVTAPEPPPQPTSRNRSPERSDSSFGEMAWLDKLIWGLLVVALLALMSFLVRMYLQSEKRQTIEVASGNARATATQIEALPAAVAALGSNGDFLGEARRLYEAGRFSEAIVYLFSYQLLELDRRQVVELARGKTNRQYLREIPRQLQPLRTLLEQTVGLFEAAFFGKHVLNRQQFESCWSQLDEFQQLTAQVQSASP